MSADRCEPQTPTPWPIRNRPGLPSLQYRIGAHESMLQTMIARLAELSADNPELESQFPVLQQLAARDGGDPSIALLDAWATLGDLLTFYQERFANENYLRTAKQRESVELLSRMIGFTPRPGLSSSVYLAFEVDDTQEEVKIPRGTPAKSTPLPGTNLLPQTFETGQEFVARPEWNLIRPRQTRPHRFGEANPSMLTFKGGGLALKPNDYLVVEPEGRTGALLNLKVESVREFSRENERFTQIRFGGIKKYDDEIYDGNIASIKAFVAKLPDNANAAFSTDHLETKILLAYTRERRLQEPISLALDDRLTDEILIDQLVRDIHEQATGLSKHFADFVNLLNQRYATSVGAYVTLHKPFLTLTRLKRIGEVKFKADGSLDEFSASVLNAKAALWFGLEASSNNFELPRVLYGNATVSAGEPDSVDSAEPFSQEFSPFSSAKFEKLRDDANDDDELRIVVTTTDGVELTLPWVQKEPRVFTRDEMNAATVADPVEEDPVIALIKTEMLGLKAKARKFAYLRITVDSKDQTKRFAEFVQPLTKTEEVAPFPHLVHDQTIFGDVAGDSVGKVSLKLGKMDLLKKYSGNTNKAYFEGNTDPVIKITVESLKKQNDDPPEQPKPPLAEWEDKASVAFELANKFQEWKVNSSKSTVHLVTFSHGGKPIAFALRRFVPNKIGKTSIRGDIADGVAEALGVSHLASAEALQDSVNSYRALQTVAKHDSSSNAELGVLSELHGHRLQSNDGWLKDLALQTIDSAATKFLQLIAKEVTTDLDTKLGVGSPLFQSRRDQIASNLDLDDESSLVDVDCALTNVVSLAFGDPPSLGTDGQTRLDPFMAFLERESPFHVLVSELASKASRNRQQFLANVKDLHSTLAKAGFTVESFKQSLETLDAKVAKYDEEQALVEYAFDAWKQVGGSIQDICATLEPEDGDGPLDQLEKEYRRRQDSPNATRLQQPISELRSIVTNATGDRGSVPNASALTLQQIAQQRVRGRTIASQVGATLLKSLLKSSSGLQTQVLSALNPDERRLIVSEFRQYRNFKARRPRVWRFRQTGPLFGWNAPTDATTKVKTATNGAQDVEIEPPGHKDPPLNELVESINVVHLDGASSDNKDDSVCAIARTTESAPFPYRVRFAAPGTRTDYGISNATSQLTLENGWWFPKAQQATNYRDNEKRALTQLENSGTLDDGLLAAVMAFAKTSKNQHLISKANKASGKEWRLRLGDLLLNLKAVADEDQPTITISLLGNLSKRIEDAVAEAAELDRERLPRTLQKWFENQGGTLADGVPVKRVANAPKGTREWTADFSPDRSYRIVFTADSDLLEVFGPDGFGVLRTARVWSGAAELALAANAISDTNEGPVVNGETIELDDFYPYLTSQSKLIFRGIPISNDDAPPDTDDELAYVSEFHDVIAVRHLATKAYGDRIHTTVDLHRPLTRRYWRDKLKIYANVVEATHGETIREVLGSGNGREANQKLALKAGPLTRLPAANPRGEEPQLNVRVNKVLWDEERLSTLDDDDQAYELSQNTQGAATLLFGDGRQGRRLPTGNENIRAAYRTGLGSAGNVDANRIDQLPSPPLGVMSVSNPIRAAGGADADGVEQTRLRAGLAAARLGRLISAEDFASFALSFAGVDKAHAQLDDETAEIILTVAGPEADPLPLDGLLMRNLNDAMRQLGDPEARFTLLPHRSLLIFLKANVKVDRAYVFEDVRLRIRERLFEQFAYRRRGLNQAVLRADLIATMQTTEGVELVDVDLLGPLDAALDQTETKRNLDRIALPRCQRPRVPKPDPGANSSDAAQAASPRLSGDPRSAEICFFDLRAPDTLIVEPIE